ncbi:MAG TPA: HD domain-containing phosphohydrolase [Steroidobacteraceae bacterium]|nr:HD domain-containing phosphohydrolase [Steroidobacteraceae bacterium]HEX5163313.1 HD domain-containing phosphohydrolase [Steroidobacteraceae bacterium]
MKDRVLFVDDEPNVLDGIRRQLRNRVDLETATSGNAGLEIIRSQGPFAVVVSDMRMPEMDGARFLAKVNEIAPQTVRMVLSGQADLESTIAAVNEGRVFRFLLKPCNSETLFGVIKNGIDQYRLMHAEKHLLENTLNATVKVLFNVLGLINPVAQRRAAQIQRYAESAAAALNLEPNMWQYHLAAMVSQLGCITLPQETLARALGGQPLSADEKRLYESHPEIAGKLLGTIPRLEAVAAMVAGQMQVPSRDLANGTPATWEPEKIGAAILWAAVTFDRHVSLGRIPEQAAQLVNQAAPGLPPAMTAAMVKTLSDDSGLVMTRSVMLRELESGMVIDADVMSVRGTRLVPRGTEVTAAVIDRLHAVAGGVGVNEPIRVSVKVLD